MPEVDALDRGASLSAQDRPSTTHSGAIPPFNSKELQCFAFSSHGFLSLIRLSNALFLESGGVDFDLPFPVSRSRFQDLGQPPGSRESLFGRRRKFAFLQFAKFFEICFHGSLADRFKDLVLFNPPKVVFAGRRPPVGHIEVEGLCQPVGGEEARCARRCRFQLNRIARRLEADFSFKS
jgi:hypothetical protein